jgi:hypothetical protein
VLDRLQSDPLSPWMDVLGVRYVITHWDMPRGKFTLVGETTAKVFGNPQAFPKAYFAPRFARAPEEREIAYVESHDSESLLSAPLVATPRKLPTDPEPESRSEAASATDIASARVLGYAPNEVIVETQARRPGWLVLTDAYDPDWSAKINGKRAEVERANVVQRAVRVPQGRSRVVFRYRPKWFKAGVFLSMIGWMWAAILFLTFRKKQ